MTKIVTITPMFPWHIDSPLIMREVFYHCRDMDSIVKIEELPRTGDGRRFIVTGTPH